MSNYELAIVARIWSYCERGADGFRSFLIAPAPSGHDFLLTGTVLLRPLANACQQILVQVRHLCHLQATQDFAHVQTHRLAAYDSQKLMRTRGQHRLGT